MVYAIVFNILFPFENYSNLLNQRGKNVLQKKLSGIFSFEISPV